MSSNRRGLEGKMKLTSYDELFGEENTNEVVDATSGQSVQKLDGQVVELALDDLVPFDGHPFKVVDDEKMEETVDSIRENGVLVPIMVRHAKYIKDKSKYEIISGHRRCHASKLAGKETIPAIIKECSNYEAIVAMVDANIQREDISISEKVKAYSMKYKALKHQGTQGGGSSLQAMSEASGENKKTIQRYLRLSFLTDDLLALVDEKKLGIGQGIDISYLKKEEQESVTVYIVTSKKPMSLQQSATLKDLSQKGALTSYHIMQAFNEEEKPAVPRKVSFNAKKLDSYFTPDKSNKDIEKLIIQLLEEWKAKGGE